MLTARDIRKENPAEYLIYMFRTEDTLRAFHNVLQQIEENLIKPLRLPESVHRETLDWYKNLVLMMDKENIRESGHFQFIRNLINEIYDFHLRIMETGADEEYIKTYKSVAGLIAELKRKSAEELNDLEICLNALYGYMLMNIRHEVISENTRLAMKQFSAWLGLLSDLFRRFETGHFEL
jgi:hypothetical protein